MMSLFAMLAGCGGATLKTVTFTQSTTWTAPLTTSRLESAVGYGARGTDASGTYVSRYESYSYNQRMRRDNGQIESTAQTYDGNYSGSVPPDYCMPWIPTPDDAGYSQSRTCFTHKDASYFAQTPATQGAAATMTGAGGFSRTFPGSMGNVAPSNTVFTNVAVTPGQGYSITVPAGGAITITYYE